MEPLAALRSALAAHEPTRVPALPGRTNHLRAGVLVPIVWGERPRVVATARPHSLRLHGGEIAWPGGRAEPFDADLCATALREAREELGIRDAEVLGTLSAVPLYTSDYRLVPTVALVADAFVPNPGEVAAVLRYDLLAILEADRIEAIPWEHEGITHLSPVFALDEHVMFGGTAHVFLELLGVAAAAFGLPLPPLRPGRYSWSDLL